MKKWATLLKSAVFSLVIYLWFLGSSLVIKIDNENQLQISTQQKYSSQVKIWEQEMHNLSQRLSSNCNQKSEIVGSLESHFSNSTTTNVNKQSTKFSVTRNGEQSQINPILVNARKEKVIRDNLIYIPELKQMWCLVPKAASTSWSHRIVEALPSVSGKLKRDLKNGSIPVQVSLRKHYGNIGTKLFNKLLYSDQITKIALVRHPFSRIISAFEDKLKNRKAKPDSMYFYGHYGVKINRTFRKNWKMNKRKEPTFEEFVDYLIETDPLDYDEHWKPISLLCGLCYIKYDHLIKQEELAQTFFFHLVKLGFLPQVSPNGVDHQVRDEENRSNWEFRQVHEYFKNISEEKIFKLYKKYESDFSLFGYSRH